MLVDCTAAETAPLLSSALASGMDLVLANKRPLAGPREVAEALWADARQRGRRILHETTVGAGLPVFDTYYKLYESGDRVQRIRAPPPARSASCSPRSAAAARSPMPSARPWPGYTEPDPREDLSGQDVARKALILGRLLGFRGELQDVAIEPLVPRIRAASAARVPVSYRRARSLVGGACEGRARALARPALPGHGHAAQGLRSAWPRWRRATASAGLSGTDNQIAFTTRRYDRHNPLVIKGPGAGLAVTAAGCAQRRAETRGVVRMGIAKRTADAGTETETGAASRSASPSPSPFPFVWRSDLLFAELS